MYLPPGPTQDILRSFFKHIASYFESRYRQIDTSHCTDRGALLVTEEVEEVSYLYQALQNEENVTNGLDENDL